MFKFTPEVVVASVAVLFSAAGGIVTTAVHWGVVNDRVDAIQLRLVDHDKKLEIVQSDATEQKVHNAKVEQSLVDVLSSLDRVEKSQERYFDKPSPRR